MSKGTLKQGKTICIGSSCLYSSYGCLHRLLSLNMSPFPNLELTDLPCKCSPWPVRTSCSQNSSTQSKGLGTLQSALWQTPVSCMLLSICIALLCPSVVPKTWVWHIPMEIKTSWRWRLPQLCIIQISTEIWDNRWGLLVYRHGPRWTWLWGERIIELISHYYWEL